MQFRSSAWILAAYILSQRRAITFLCESYFGVFTEAIGIRRVSYLSVICDLLFHKKVAHVQKSSHIHAWTTRDPSCSTLVRFVPQQNSAGSTIISPPGKPITGLKCSPFRSCCLIARTDARKKPSHQRATNNCCRGRHQARPVCIKNDV